MNLLVCFSQLAFSKLCIAARFCHFGIDGIRSFGKFLTRIISMLLHIGKGEFIGGYLRRFLLLFSVHPEPNGRKVDKMLTLKKVKEMVKAPVHTKRVPSPKVLLEEGRIFPH